MRKKLGYFGLLLCCFGVMGCSNAASTNGSDATVNRSDSASGDASPGTGDSSVPAARATCAACENDSQCGSSARCVALGSGGVLVCLPACEMTSGACPADYQCEEGVCRPASGSCCQDPDGDGYGEGADCLGEDCAEGDDGVFPGAPEVCNGEDEDCDTTIDEGDAAVLCPPADHVAETACAVGVCTLVSCEERFADCNGDGADGCETPTDTLTDCASCGGVCELAHATTSCDSAWLWNKA